MKMPVRYSGVILLLCGVILFCPYKSTTVPAWRIQVVDGAGKPIAGLRVLEQWQYFDVDNAPWVDTRVTDNQGRVAFPRRTNWASLAGRATMRHATDGVHAGPSFFIQACDESHPKEAKFFGGGSRFWNPAVHQGESVLVAKPVPECGEVGGLHVAPFAPTS